MLESNFPYSLANECNLWKSDGCDMNLGKQATNDTTMAINDMTCVIYEATKCLDIIQISFLVEFAINFYKGEKMKL